MLSDLLKEHMARPRNQKVMPNACGVGDMVGPVCGDRITFYLRVEKSRIAGASFTTHGCWAAVAVASILCGQVAGMTPGEALALDSATVLGEEPGLPDDKQPCVELVFSALRLAVRDCLRRR